MGLQWVGVVEESESHQLLRPPADVFFGATVSVGHMSRSDLQDMVGRRVRQIDSADLDTLLDMVETRNPRRLLEVVREYLLSGTPPYIDGLVERERVLAAAGRPAHMLFVELQGREGVSASDEWLQKRMGWTRPRLVQVLSQLEAAGLATSSVAPSSGGAGRPRKVFRIVPAAEFARRQADDKEGSPTSPR